MRSEFERLLKKGDHPRLTALVMQSEQVLKDTLNGDTEAVVKVIQNVRDTNYGPGHNNNEQALHYTIKFAYITCVDYFMKVEELPSGKGLADLVYLPLPDTAYPAMVIELKWEETADAAIRQIRDRNYPAVLADYYGEIVLVGISYNSKTKQHICNIERVNKDE